MDQSTIHMYNLIIVTCLPSQACVQSGQALNYLWVDECSHGQAYTQHLTFIMNNLHKRGHFGDIMFQSIHFKCQTCTIQNIHLYFSISQNPNKPLGPN